MSLTGAAWCITCWRGTRLGLIGRSPRGLRPTLGPDGAPIRNPYREIVSIAYGFFSPLEGFMPWNEVESVLKERRLLNGWLFPSSDAERASCGYEVFMERALFVAGAGGCGRRDRRREAWDLWMRRF